MTGRMGDRGDDVVIVNGVPLDPPRSLSVAEVSLLGWFNAGRNSGRLPHDVDLAFFERLQLRFDWLGYYTEDGQQHGGRRAGSRFVRAAMPQRKRWWQR